MAEIIMEISDLLDALPHSCEEVKRGIQECLIDAHVEFEAVVDRENAAERRIVKLKKDLRYQKEQLNLLRHQTFCGSSDNNFLGADDDEDDVPDDDVEEEEEEEQKPRKGKQKQKRPKNIKTEVYKHFPEETHCSCGAKLKTLGSWTSSRLRVVREHFVLEKHVHYSRGCNCSAACKEHAPYNAHATGYIMAGRTLDAKFVINAVCQHFYEHSTDFRAERRYHDNGCNVARSTLGRNATHIAEKLEPLWEEVWKHVTAGPVVHMDETPLRVIPTEKGRGKCIKGTLWAIHRDERGWGGDPHPAIYFEYDPSRGGHVAERMLEGALSQVVQVDGYKGYNVIRRAPGKNAGFTLARCMAHVRRKFTDAEKAAPSTCAKRVIKALKTVYAVEERVFGRSPEERQAVRVAEALPVLEKIRADMLRIEPTLAKGNLKTAANYFLAAWDDMIRYVLDGRIAIDNNPVERGMRPVALTKKNSLFAGNHEAAKKWALFNTLIETARLNGVNPFRYLNWVVDQIELSRELTDYSQLMPWHCKAALGDAEDPSENMVA
ncbi:hypothetical protein U717_07995 [Rhodobacter capsulatus R121]|uniref:Transposase, IS66 family n=2 Tax=Rhodobacter capsulatus TaxID=1061 RepID=D5ASI2_RHOCB|nr:transposase, IS66 family [Rhodobacter capsulatus SB 1003]ETD02182.1 hypothetical protein U714_07825 [Rhodobacter capsulatus DE442]ETD77871.1 hypothetical protein U717_07995 [Rhodobacter capsulatus R121]ETE54214.1 hypothetical protein U715_07995 [Rhodobacter capsulatus Y262]